MIRARPIAGLLLLAGAAGAAEVGPIRASGYLKNVWQYSASAFDDRPYFLNLSRARLTLDAARGIWRTHVDYDHEVLAGSYFRTLEYAAGGLGDAPTWLDMDQSVSTSATHAWRHRLYRGWAGIETEKLILRAGRQRIAWGTGKFWNPTDILNPYRPTAVERDERSGVDALYGRYAPGELSQAELAVAPRDRWADAAALGRWRSNLQGFDWSLMGGKASASTSSWVVGGDFAGNLWNGSLHGEWSYTDLKTRRPFWRTSLGYEYTLSVDAPLGLFLKEATLMIEYYHNGRGTTHVFRYDLAALLSGSEVALAKNYLAFSYARDIHPLIRLELVSITNLDDASHFLAPTLQWNVLPDLYLLGGLQRLGGGRFTEYGRLPNLGFVQAQYYY